MKKFISFLTAFAVGAVFWNCSTADDEVPVNNERWKISMKATKDSGEVVTRGLYIGGASGNRYISIWDKKDVVQVYKSGTASLIGTMKPVNTSGVATTDLTGTFTGSVSEGETLDLYLPSADIDYTGQKGTLADMTNYAFLSTQVRVNRIEGGVVYSDEVKFTGKESYLRLSFIDSEDEIRLPIERLIIQAESGKILLKKPLTPTPENPVVYGDLEINTEKTYGKYPEEVYVAMHNDLGANDNYTFTVVSGGYVYVSGVLNYNFKDSKFVLATRKVTLLSAAARISNTSSVDNFTDGNGSAGENGSINF